MSGPLASYALWAGLLGGLALFLLGMDIMTRSLKRAAGSYLKDILAKLTRNRFVGMAMGAFTTSVIQSSSITTVILVGFISAGLLSMAQSIPVIIGANIGTTITAQILAFKVTKLALPMIAIGFFVSFISKRESLREYALIMLGLGLVFYGMGIMSEAMRPLRSHQPFIDFMASLDNPLLAALVGAAFTAVVQSSSATTGILIVMAGQGLIGLEGAIALALGANVGTCITAGLAALGKPREAARAAAVHVIFNVLGVALWISFVPQLAELSQLISPARPELTGLDRLAAEAPRQIANIHTFFNVVNALVFVGFTTQLARFVEWVIPDRPLRDEEMHKPKFLDKALLFTPSVALDAARLEVGRMGKRVRNMVEAALPVVLSGTRQELHDLHKMDRAVDALHKAIIAYLGKISLSNLTGSQSELLMELIRITNDLEQIGDRVATGLVRSAHKRLDENVTISAKTAKIIAKYHTTVLKVLDGALDAAVREDKELARKTSALKRNVTELGEMAARHGVERLTADAPNRLATYTREIELIEILDGIYRIARRIARTQLHRHTMEQPEAPAEPEEAEAPEQAIEEKAGETPEPEDEAVPEADEIAAAEPGDDTPEPANAAKD